MGSSTRACSPPSSRSRTASSTRSAAARREARVSWQSRHAPAPPRRGGTLMHDTRFWHPFADMGAVRGAEFVIERGDDVWVWDTDGHRYLDATASLWYANVGHGRPEIAAAVAAQMAKIAAYSAFGDFSAAATLELTDMLAERAPMPARVFLTSGGG